MQKCTGISSQQGAALCSCSTNPSPPSSADGFPHQGSPALGQSAKSSPGRGHCPGPHGESLSPGRAEGRVRVIRAAQLEETRGAHLHYSWAEEVPGSAEQITLGQIHIPTSPLLHWHFCNSPCALSHTATHNRTCETWPLQRQPVAQQKGTATLQGERETWESRQVIHSLYILQ